MIEAKLNQLKFCGEGIGTVIYLGAGLCPQFDAIRELNPESVVLIEAEKEAFTYLQKHFGGFPDVSLINKVVVSEKDDLSKTFNVTNLAAYSSILELDRITECYPNLRVDSVEKPDSITIPRVCKRFLQSNDEGPILPHREGGRNILIVDLCGYEGELLSSLDGNTLKLFDSIIFSSSRDPLYKGAISFESLRDFFADNGFQIDGAESVSYPFFISSVKRDLLSESVQELKNVLGEKSLLEEKLKEYKEQLHAAADMTGNLRKNLQSVNAELERVKKAFLEVKQSQDLERGRYQRELKNTKEKLQESVRKREEISFDLQQAKAEIDSYKVAAEKDAGLAKEVASLSTTIEVAVKKQLESTEKVQKAFERKLAKGLDNSVKQVESFISLQRFLGDSSINLDFHGWPISSDIALFLISRIEERQYDLILEFGSGTSTVLFAHAVSNCHRSTRVTSPRKEFALEAHEEKAVTVSEADALRAFGDDLPRRIVSFEHNNSYFKKTKEKLAAQGLERLVDLVHAPLTSIDFGEDKYLYYACEAKLLEIARIFTGRKARVLVLIDGPPGATGPLARYPALPILLDTLGVHQLDIILDDYSRPEEQEIVGRWRRDMDARGVEYKEEELDCEKGAYICQINS